MKLANLLMERRVKMDLVSRTKDEAVLELLEMIGSEGIRLDVETILESIREREQVEDTSYGRGFAFPHARTDAVDEMYILIGVSRSGLEDRTFDSVPVHVVCLLLYLDYQPLVIESRISQLIPVAMRMEMMTGSGNCTLINDSYNSDN